MSNYLDSYKSIFLDINLRDFWAVRELIYNEKSLPSLKVLNDDLTELWSKRNHEDGHYYLPLLCVRTGLDLFFRANQFPAESEVIMSAINIPSMVTLTQYHQLRVIPCDIDRRTLKIDINHLKSLVTLKTVAIVYAHIYGRCIDVTDLVDFANENHIYFIEDCAESFTGFCSCTINDDKSDRSNIDMHCSLRINNNIEPSCYLGHPRSHLILFSFGVLKFCTALGGGMAKFADQNLYNRMSKIYYQDPIQDTQQYANNCKKYFYLYWLLNVPNVIKPLMYIIRFLNLKHMEYVVHRLRAFNSYPSQDELFESLRRQPCRPLLAFLHNRFKGYHDQHLRIQREKSMYVIDRLNRNLSIETIGMDCPLRNFWLFPIIVNAPDLFVKHLSTHHIDAYRGTTQLNCITRLTDDHIRCPNAEYLIEHVIYLPVHCHVPKTVLDQLIDKVNRIGEQMEAYPLRSKL